jgi:excisionase family DNA binding protein
LHFDKENSLYVPIWEKSNLTVEEATSYFGIGRDKIKEISNDDRCPFVLWVGNKRLIKRKRFEEYLDKMFSV